MTHQTHSLYSFHHLAVLSLRNVVSEVCVFGEVVPRLDRVISSAIIKQLMMYERE